MPSSRFDRKIVAVTGGAGAIGSATAIRFANEGATLAIVDKDGGRAEVVADQIRSAGGNAVAFTADVSDERQVKNAVAGIIEIFGAIDILFNNAGIGGTRSPVYELPVDIWDEIVRINLRSQFIVQQHVLKAMIKGRRGEAIINMSSSMAGFDVHAGGAAYAATKHAILGLTRAAAIDVARFGIRVNAICPGVVETPLGITAEDPAVQRAEIQYRLDRIPIGRVGQPADIAGIVTFLASPDAAHITGIGWLIDGGQTLQSWANAPRDSTYAHGW
jgi:NAD(P)-dependent dehydrogenase (short-subunit alcohol dehydrogenase family)